MIPSATEVLDRAQQLESEGRYLEAVDELSAANRRRRDPEIDRRLVPLRFQAFEELAAGPGRGPWPPSYPDPFPGAALAEVHRTDLDAPTLGGGILHHGCLVVRSLLDSDQVARSISGVDNALAVFDRRKGRADSDTDERWYEPFDPEPGQKIKRRDWVAQHRALWLSDSPPTMFDVLEAFGGSGVLAAVAGYLGERPALSVQKTTLRRTPPTERPVAWHQDGSFLDAGVRTVNIWVALSHCGGESDAPGLDIIPRRMSGVLETDGDLAQSSVAHSSVARVAEETPVVRPVFAPGDALLFDELFLHATGLSPGMTRSRYAIECWCFAPSHFPRSYVPLAC